MMYTLKWLILIGLLYPSNALLAMNALRIKQDSVAKKELKDLRIKPVDQKAEQSNSNELILLIPQKKPTPAEKIEINNKLIDLLIQNAKYETTLDGKIANNDIYYANKVKNEADTLAKDQNRSRHFYILTYLLFQTLDDLKEKKIITDEQYKEFDDYFATIYRYRNSWFTQQANPPKTLQDLQAIINANQNVSQAELDNLIGYYIEFDQKDSFTDKFKNAILKDFPTFETYFGSQFADYYLEQRDQYLNKRNETSWSSYQGNAQPEAAIKPLNNNLTLEEAQKLEAYEIFGLPKDYANNLWEYRDLIKTRYKRLSKKLHPDKKPNNQKMAEEVFKKIQTIFLEAFPNEAEQEQST